MAIENLQLAVNENRKIAHELVAPDFSKECFLGQLGKLFRNMLEAAGILVELHTDKFSEAAISDEQKLALYRVAQEQCTNIIKYAEARKVMAFLSSAGGSMYMRVTDDGKGTSTNDQTPGIGLKNIYSRMSAFNGTASIKSEPGKGFMLEVGFPMAG